MARAAVGEHREFFIDNLLVRIHYIIVMIRWTGLAPFPFPGSLTSTFLVGEHVEASGGLHLLRAWGRVAEMEEKVRPGGNPGAN